MSEGGGPDLESISDRYRLFAANEARGVSPLYERLATAIADSEELLTFVRSLPVEKRQPNLVLAAVRWECGLADDGGAFLDHVRKHGPRIRATIEARRTQTNEARRCATLLPVLSRLPQPLALLEVGASAGLCLLPDRYGYRYGSTVIPPPDDGAPTLVCDVPPGTAVPGGHPDVSWRRGLDLSPIDVRNADETAWLQNLVWPGQEDRLETLTRAVEVAVVDPPIVEEGDLLVDLERLASAAPAGAHLVIFHSAVLSYVRPEDRARFREVVAAVDATWISNEGAVVFPDIAERAGDRARPDRFLLAVDGEPVAVTGHHGQSFAWI